MAVLRPILVLALFVVSLVSCSENNRNAEQGTESGEIIFPHPEEWADPISHGFAFLTADSNPRPERCQGCHVLDGTSTDGAAGCWTCHEGYPHVAGWGESNLHVTHLVSATGDFKANRDAACATSCHGSDLKGGLSNVACTTCHADYPHEASYADVSEHGIDVLQDTSTRHAVCRSCHSQDLDGGTFAVSCRSCHTYPNLAASEQHEPAENEECTSCHVTSIGAAGGPNLLQDIAPTLCFDCHDEGKTPQTNEHSIVTSGDACATCHVPHDGDRGNLLRKQESDLCLSCHNQEIVTAEYGTTRNIEAEVTSTNPHEPARDGDCSLCHQPHGSSWLRLLKEQPLLFNGPRRAWKEDDIVCFTCHDFDVYGSGTASSYTLQTPITRPAPDAPTHFLRELSGGNTQNLHWVHVWDEGVSCHGCHNPHGSNYNYGLRDWLMMYGAAGFTDPGANYWRESNCGVICHAWTPDPATEPHWPGWPGVDELW